MKKIKNKIIFATIPMLLLGGLISTLGSVANESVNKNINAPVLKYPSLNKTSNFLSEADYHLEFDETDEPVIVFNDESIFVESEHYYYLVVGYDFTDTDMVHKGEYYTNNSETFVWAEDSGAYKSFNGLVSNNNENLYFDIYGFYFDTYEVFTNNYTLNIDGYADYTIEEIASIVKVGLFTSLGEFLSQFDEGNHSELGDICESFLYKSDYDQPIIYSENNIYISNENLLSVSDIIHLTNTYAYDLNDGMLDLEIVKDNYTKNLGETGEYEIKLKAIDSAENVATSSIYANVIEDVNPNLILVGNGGTFKVSKSVLYSLDETDFIEFLIVTGSLDEADYTTNDIDGLFRSISKEKDIEFGEYEVEFVSDSTSANYTIEVIDDDYLCDSSINGFEVALKVISVPFKLIWCALDYTIGSIVRTFIVLFGGQWLPYCEHVIW